MFYFTVMLTVAICIIPVMFIGYMRIMLWPDYVDVVRERTGQDRDIRRASRRGSSKTSIVSTSEIVSSGNVNDDQFGGPGSGNYGLSPSGPNPDVYSIGSSVSNPNQQ